jgi:hypothetical protein
MKSLLLAALIVAVIICIFMYTRGNSVREPFVDIVSKVIERPHDDVITLRPNTVGVDEVHERSALPCDSVVIDSIPLVEEVPQVNAADAPIAVIPTDEKPHISLTFDAAVARNALMRSRDKRVYDAVANRTSDYFRPFFEEELKRNDVRDWWDDVAYPMNDSGEYSIVPEISPSDRYATPWEGDYVPFARAV